MKIHNIRGEGGSHFKLSLSFYEYQKIHPLFSQASGITNASFIGKST